MKGIIIASAFHVGYILGKYSPYWVIRSQIIHTP